MISPKELKKLNGMLRRELGENPLFAWKKTEELTIGMHDGYDYVATPPFGIIKQVPRYKQRLICRTPNRWVIATRVEGIPEDVWLKRFGWKLQWPNGESWYPVSGARGFAMLDPGEVPTLDTTEYAIARVRHERATPGTTEAEMRAADLKRKANRLEQRRLQVLESLPRTLASVVNPGGKNDYVFGGLAEPQPQHQGVTE